MDKKEEINRRLEKLLSEVQTIYELVNQEEPHLPMAAAQKVANGICLECGQKMTDAERHKSKRGCHQKCHRKVLRSIESGKYTEYEAIQKGRLAPIKKGGRPPQLTSLEKEIETGDFTSKKVSSTSGRQATAKD